MYCMLITGQYACLYICMHLTRGVCTVCSLLVNMHACICTCRYNLLIIGYRYIFSVIVNLMDHNEQYEITLPSAYARYNTCTCILHVI